LPGNNLDLDKLFTLAISLWTDLPGYQDSSSPTFVWNGGPGLCFYIV